MNTSILEAKTRTGAAKFWQGHVVKIGKKWYTRTSYWQINKAGKKSLVQWSEPYEATPKNVGKANETSAEEQAKLELESMFKKQLDKGYSEQGKKKSTKRPLPMLANKFKERGHKITWPAYVQPKFNGMRMLYDGKKAWSRMGKDIIPEVIQHLKFETWGHIVDGELILPGNLILQETMKAAKKFYPGLSDTLLYIVYDVVEPDKTFSERYDILKKLVTAKGVSKNVILAPTHQVIDVADVVTYHKKFTSEKYEGTMIRDNSCGYEIGHRSNQLQKYKDFVDAEFEIIGVKEGEGSFKGCAIFKCITLEGKDFDCTPEGSMEHRKELFKNRDNYIGKFLTVQYAELTKDKKPQFPVGVDIRDTRNGGI